MITDVLNRGARNLATVQRYEEFYADTTRPLADLAYEAANRDSEVFERPHEFDIRRPANRRNVTFEFGTHVCIAAPLVRMETKILLEKLVTRFSRFEIAGPGRRPESFLRNGWVELPMAFHL